MVDFSSAAVESQFDPEPIATRNARYGRMLFFPYLLLYGLFVALNTFWPRVMDLVPAAGVNLAIWYGLGLIVLAMLLAGLYAWLCRSNPARDGQTRPAA